MKITYEGLPEIDLPDLNAETIPAAEALLAPVLTSYLGPQTGQAVAVLGAGCGLAAFVCLFRGAKVTVIEPQEACRRRFAKTQAANRPRGNGSLSLKTDIGNLQDDRFDLVLYLGTEGISLDQAIKLGGQFLRNHGRLLLFVPSKEVRREAEKLLESDCWTGIQILESQSWGRNGNCRYILEACHAV